MQPIVRTSQEHLPSLNTDYPVVLDYNHYFSDGVYTREMIMSSGDLIVGKIHKKSSVNILLEGAIAVSVNGERAQLIEAPHVFVTHPGDRKIGIALTDVRFLNAFPNPDNNQNHGELVEDLMEDEELTMQDMHSVDQLLALEGSLCQSA